MNPFNAYKYLYYRIYSWQLWAWGETNQPQLNALLGVTFLIYLNVYTLLVGINLVTGFSIIEQLSIGKLKLIILMGVIGIVNYFIFLHNGKYKQIAKQFKKESEAKRRRNFYLCLVYVVLSFAICFTFVLLSPKGTKFLIQ